MTSMAWLIVAQVLGATPIDCIKEGGEMQCTEPYPLPYTYGECVPSLLSPVVNREALCWSRNPGASSSEGGLMNVLTCIAEYNLCPGTVALGWPGWSPQGAVEAGYDFLCGTYRVRYQNGYEVSNFAVAHPTGMVNCPPPPDGNGAPCACGAGMYPTGTVIGFRNRQLTCPAGYSTATRPNGDLRCYRCPEHSTWDGTQCKCERFYFK